MRHTSVKDWEKAISGGEPSWKNGETSIIKALNWYNYHSDTKESKKFTLHYLNEIQAAQDEIDRISEVPDAFFQNLGFVCRIKLRGAPISMKNQMWIDNFLDTLKQHRYENKAKVEEEKPIVTVQERVADKAREHIAELEAAIDDAIQERKFKDFGAYAKMQASLVKGAHAKFIVSFFTGRYNEIIEAMIGVDKQLAEGYSFLTKAQLKEYSILLKTLISDAQKLEHNSKLSRAPRKKKVKSVDKVISKLNYKKDDNGLKLVSVNPVDIVGCSQLWVFNTKTRKLGVYHAEDSAGITVKGSSLVNYNSTTSIQKTVRKPEIVLPEVVKAGKITLKKILPDIKAVDQELSGRINSDTILLRAIK
jgi:hypothetical protein